MSNDKKKKELARIIAGRMSPGAPQQIDAVRSTTGQIKGFLTKDTLYRLRQAVEDHQKAADENGALVRLGIILGLCDTYLNKHGSEKDARAREKVAMVEDMKAEASAERSRREAEAIYLQDAYAQATAEPGSKGYSATRMADQSAPAAAVAGLQAKQLAQGKATQTQEGFNQATLELIKKYGLTEAEVLAVKVYTANDYKYISPATANDKKWMTGQFPPNMADERAAMKKELDQAMKDVAAKALEANESGETAEDPGPGRTRRGRRKKPDRATIGVPQGHAPGILPNPRGKVASQATLRGWVAARCVGYLGGEKAASRGRVVLPRDSPDRGDVCADVRGCECPQAAASTDGAPPDQRRHCRGASPTIRQRTGLRQPGENCVRVHVSHGEDRP